ncbi:MAG: hypothetical protein QE285_12025 [Aquabacterium sp.]|nr:hypothetical protein [Aquabacterium sp.]
MDTVLPDTHVLRVRIDTTVLALPASAVVAIARLDQPGWSGVDVHQAPLHLVRGPSGPLLALAAPLLLCTTATSQRPAWAVELATADGAAASPMAAGLAVAVCEVLGLQSGEATPGVLRHPTH